MNAVKRADAERKGASLQVEGARAEAPLRQCVRDALEHYFEALDGHECQGLFDLVMGEVEAPLLEAVLDHTDGNQSKAAQVLGINRGTLRKKLKQYNLEP